MKVKEEWKAYSSWEKVKSQYLDKWYSATEHLSKVISTEQLGGKVTRESYTYWGDFYNSFYNILMLIYVKIPKVNDVDKKIFDNHIDAMLHGGRKEVKDYFEILMVIGAILDKLGYNSPELKTKPENPFLTDTAFDMAIEEEDL